MEICSVALSGSQVAKCAIALIVAIGNSGTIHHTLLNLISNHTEMSDLTPGDLWPGRATPSFHWGSTLSTDPNVELNVNQGRT